MHHSLVDEAQTLVISRAQRCCWYSGFAGKLSDGFHLSVMHYADVVALIVVLFAARCPFTVPWRVWAVIVESFNGISGSGSKSHISNEVIERLPTNTNPNASPTVVLKVGICWVVASLSDSLPANMFRPIRKSVACFGLRDALAVFAAAAQRFALSQIANMDMFFRSADASARNERHLILPVRIGQRDPISESLTSRCVYAFHDLKICRAQVHHIGQSPYKEGVWSG